MNKTENCFENLTIEKVHKFYKQKIFSCTQLTKYYLEKLKKDNKCLITINDKALQTAKIVDEKLEKNIPLSVLEGIPYILKDNIITKGLKTTCASKILKDYIPRFDSFVNKIITKQNGILLGKANLDEFAMGSTCENSSFFITPNPLNPKNICGGSSGGCAYALAKDYCVFALGSDTGGSARLPAALCNVYGFKPTYGTISRYGLAEYASSFDQIAPMAKCQEDCLTVFLQISKKDINDETCVGYKTKIINQKSFKIAIPKNYKKYCEKQVVDSFQKKVDALKTVENIFINYIDFDYFDEMLKTYYIVSFAQSYSNLSRYKSFLKDKQKNIYYDFNGEYLNDREIGFGSEVKQRIKNGSEILNKENYKSRYIKETEIIDILKLKTKKIFKEYDFLITPTAPKAAIKINYMTNSSAKQLDIFTVFANLTEIPALSIPLNNSVAMQIMAEKMSDEKIFNFIQNV